MLSLRGKRLGALKRSGIPAVVLFACAPLLADAQDQRPKYQGGWPCTGTVDPSYVSTAEATGGKVLLFRPSEVGGAAADVSASQRHEETVFRAGGRFADGVYHFEVPLDSTIESAYFFISIQCLQFVSVLQPSGEELRVDAPDVESHAFEAIRLLTIKTPAPGVWTVRIAGRGLLSLIVSAKTDLRLTGVSLVDGGVPVKGLTELGKRLRLEASMSGAANQIGFRFISSNAATIRGFELDLEKETAVDRTYAGEVTLPDKEFRIAITGTDEKGFRFERVHNRLFVAPR